MTYKPSSTHTIAFYNLENLFDIEDDAFTNDNDFLPTSDRKWTKKKYERKLYKLGSAISKIGVDETSELPAIIGLAEVENKTVLRDLLSSKDLENQNYKFVHYDSFDERGIDVALVYDADKFQLKSSEVFPIVIEDEQHVRDFTRDVLLVSGSLGDEEIHFIVNHWPSRREGEKLSDYKRQLAAEVNINIVQKLRLIYHEPSIVILGDFNDNPDNDSVKHLIDKTGMFNAMSEVWSDKKGSLNHDFRWIFFDQILLSPNFITSNRVGWRLVKSEVFNQKFLTQYNGKFQGQPYRTFVGKRYKGGFSDHFPVYILIEKEE